MNCMQCGAEMINTTGGNYYCPKCGAGINDLVYRPSNCDMPMPQGFGEQGWICPVCGRGLAPWVNFCPCQGSEIKITYGTGIIDNYDLTDYIEYMENYNTKHNKDDEL